MVLIQLTIQTSSPAPSGPATTSMRRPTKRGGENELCPCCTFQENHGNNGNQGSDNLRKRTLPQGSLYGSRGVYVYFTQGICIQHTDYKFTYHEITYQHLHTVYTNTVLKPLMTRNIQNYNSVSLNP